MRYAILGTKSDSKEEVRLTIDAPDPLAARAEAKAQGIDVVRLEPIDEEPGTVGRADDDAAPREPVLVRIEPGYVQTIERTGKTWKAFLLVGWLLLALGATTCGWSLLRDPSAAGGPPLLAWMGGAVALVGLAIFLFGRLGAWWFHG